MLKLGVISDEVSQDLEQAAGFAVHYGLDALELRSVNGVSPFEWDEAQVRAFRAVADRHNLRIAAISAPLFKCDIHDPAAVASHVEGFRRCAQYCAILGCRIIRGFDFWNCGAPLHERAAQFAPIIELCRQYDVICAIEYDPSVHSSTPEAVRALVQALDSPCIRALYDPGNGLFSAPDSLPYPDGYNALRDILCHIHIKDAVVRDGQAQAVCVGRGQVDYPGLFRALLRDGYDGYLMLETHYRLSSALTDEQLRLPGGAAFSEGAYAASCECMEALLTMLRHEIKEENL